MLAAILRAYYSLKSLTTLPVAAGWTSRELFVAAVVVSIPGIKPMFSQATWFRFKSSNGQSSGNTHGYAANTSRSRNLELVTIGGSGRPTPGAPPAGGADRSEWRVGAKEIRGHKLHSDGSSEDLILEGSGIHITKEYNVSTTNERRIA